MPMCCAVRVMLTVQNGSFRNVGRELSTGLREQGHVQLPLFGRKVTPPDGDGPRGKTEIVRSFNLGSPSAVSVRQHG